MKYFTLLIASALAFDTMRLPFNKHGHQKTKKAKEHKDEQIKDTFLTPELLELD